VVNITPLLELIKSAESKGAVKSQGVPTEFDVVWGGISSRDRPQNKVGKFLTQMTVKEVLDWQDSIDPFYMSEASGAYQIMEDTLRELVTPNGKSSLFRLDDLFDVFLQDALAELLLQRRGLSRWENNEITDEQFGNNIAKEWASFPVMIGPNRGRSYYAGDGLNKAHISPEQVLETLAECRVTEAQPPVMPDTGEEGGVTFVDLLASLEILEEKQIEMNKKLDQLMSIFVWDGRN
jgi:hypothetical protein